MPCVAQSRISARRDAAKVLAACLKAIEQSSAPIRAEKPLGCGMQGCAWRAGAGRVLKVTCDQGEGEVGALFAAERDSLPRMLPRVYASWRLVCGNRVGDFWALWREELGSDIPIRVVDVVFLEARRALQAPWDDTLRTRLAEIRDDYRDSATIRRNVDNAIEAMDWLSNRKMSIQDLHRANWGWRPEPGELVVRDFGFVDTGASSSARPRVLASYLASFFAPRKRVIRALDPVGV